MECYCFANRSFTGTLLYFMRCGGLPLIQDAATYTQLVTDSEKTFY